MSTPNQRLLEFVFNTPEIVGTNSNPLIPGRAWRVGDSYTQEEKDSFTNRWKDFADQYPDIMAQLPVRS
jgi:hypothetical protein